MIADGLVVRVDGLASSGDGVGRLDDGRVVFVEGGVPGDLVELADATERRRLVRARIGRLREPSPDRVEPVCGHFGVCGGCHWQHIAYARQLEAKSTIVRDALVRLAGLDPGDAPLPIVPSPEPLAYRGRARLVEGDGRVGFRRRGSHEVVAIERCPVLEPAVESARGRLEVDEQAVRSPRRRGREREWEILAGSDGAVVAGPVGDRAAAEATVEIRVLGERLQARLGSFVQANAALRESLAEAVRDEVLARPPADGAVSERRRFVELHAGIGFFTLPLLRAGLRGVALESGRAAAADLVANVRRASLADRLEVRRARIERFRGLSRVLATADVVVADPPRTGLPDEVRRRLVDAAVPRMVYVSCDPATLARDLRDLVARGPYALASLRLFDLFPQTPHVETVVRLEIDHDS